jgi:hypothetical protein
MVKIVLDQTQHIYWGCLGTKVSLICDDVQVHLACLFYGADISYARTTLEIVEYCVCHLKILLFMSWNFLACALMSGKYID